MKIYSSRLEVIKIYSKYFYLFSMRNVFTYKTLWAAVTTIPAVINEAPPKYVCLPVCAFCAES